MAGNIVTLHLFEVFDVGRNARFAQFECLAIDTVLPTGAHSGLREKPSDSVQFVEKAYDPASAMHETAQYTGQPPGNPWLEYA